MHDTAPIIAAGISALASLVVGLVAWGWRGEIATLRAEMGTVRAEMGTLRAEMRAAIAESVNAFYLQINGSYTKSGLHNALAARVDGIENRVNDMGD